MIFRQQKRNRERSTRRQTGTSHEKVTTGDAHIASPKPDRMPGQSRARATAATGNLVQSQNCEASGNDPTACLWKPRPSVFVWIKANVSVCGAELPFPEPI